MKKTASFILFLAIGNASFGRGSHTTLKNGDNIYIESRNSAEKLHLEKTLEYKGVYNIVKTPEQSTRTIKILSKGGVNYRVYAQIIDSKTGEIIETTKGVNTFWSVTFNPKLKAMKKLAKKRLKPSKSLNN